MPYFDHNATAPLSPVASEAWLQAANAHWQNPSSPYRSAARARNALEDARARIGGLFGCPPEQIVFTSGATEANNAVLRHFAMRRSGATAAISAVEHPSVREAAQALFPGRLLQLPVDGNGCLELDAAKRLIAERQPDVVSVMAANNETGALQPWEDLAAYCRARNVPFHCDAVQWIGRMSLDGLSLCDYITCSAHKFGGPKGTGFLILPGNDRGFHVQRGGSQEAAYRGGTEDLPGVLAMVAALDDALKRTDADREAQTEGRDKFERRVSELLPGLRIAGQGGRRLWNTSMLVLPRHRNRRWVAHLDKLGFEVSTGSACASGKGGASHVLLAMGLTQDDAARAIRASAGYETSAADWLALADAFAEVMGRLDAEGNEHSGATNATVIEID